LHLGALISIIACNQQPATSKQAEQANIINTITITNSQQHHR